MFFEALDSYFRKERDWARMSLKFETPGWGRGRLCQDSKGFWDAATVMADGPAGFYFDELNKVRVLEPEISTQTQELKEECKEFVDSKFFGEIRRRSC